MSRTKIEKREERLIFEARGRVVPSRESGSLEPRKARRESTTDVITVDGQTMPMSEDAIAMAFAERYGGQLLYNHTSKRWHTWDGAIWRREDTRLAYEYARRLTRTLNSSGQAKWARSSIFSAVETIATADRTFARKVRDFDQYPWLLGTPAGAVDLRTGALSAPDPKLLITKATGFAPTEAGVIPVRWLAFLAEATRGDQELVSYLQKVCGYALTGKTTEHLLAFVYGPGGNGKGVLLATLMAVFGDYAQSAAMETFTAAKYDRHPTELAALCGARLVMASETESGRTWAESRIKQLTGGDRIRARFMRCDEFEFDPEFQLILVGNHKPRIVSIDDAMRRRLALIEFMHRPLKINRNLADELLAEGPAILRWMIDGCLAWQAEGLERPAAVVAATDEYFHDEDLIGSWIDECCDVAASHSEPSGLLFRSWSEFCKASSEDPRTATWFGTEMNRRGFYIDRARNGRPRFGIRLKPREGTDDPWGCQ